MSNESNTARLRKIVGWVEALRNPTEPTCRLGFVPQPNLHGLRFLGKTYAVLVMNLTYYLLLVTYYFAREGNRGRV
jgi:hypothetical protein